MLRSIHPLHFLLTLLAGWINRRQHEAIEYLKAEAHWESIAATDFFTVDVLTLRGLVAHYVLFVLWSLLEIKYLCRMRSIEVVRLTEAHATGQGLYISRTKGSNDNIVKWTPRLKAAWEAALAVRAQTLARPANQRRPTPIRPEQRFTLHGLKHCGITDTKGKKAEKKEASGHKTRRDARPL